MNPRLDRLNPYPFERLRGLFADVKPNAQLSPISLGIGEPRHATPEIVLKAYEQALRSGPSGLSSYPATAGNADLRNAFAQWLDKRYGVHVDAQAHTLPVNGSREALFALTQAVVNPDDKDAIVVSPNPFYQIYEGAALLAGATPYFANSDPARNFAVDWDSVPADIWQRTQLVFVCSPGNPTGAVMPLPEWQKLFDLSDRYGFVIASDECYSEIYFQQDAPLGGLEAAQQLGRLDWKSLVILTSLSKRSNVPGMRSGFVAGDAEIIKKFLLFRTYHGCAMAPPVQAASIAAWGDEAHVEHNRQLYREKFSQVTPVLAQVLDVRLPDASFYLWAAIPAHLGLSDTEFAKALYAEQAVTVLPGSYLARETPTGNPGAGRIRMALVAETAECLEAAHRIAAFVRQRS